MEHKEEHKHYAEHKKSKNTKFWIMAVALGLLMVISGVQAFELVSLKNKLNTDLSELVESSSKKTISTKSGGSLSDNLNNLPSMVGGC